ncbi:MAG: Rrf2 family transcriptional regulator [Candidatus Zixiibacteriota bacterium]
MKISALEEYGLRCMLRLGRCDDGKSLTISEIADQEGLTAANVRKLMMILREAGLVQSVRGRLGGYALNGNPSDITVGRILTALGGRMFDSQEFCGKFTGDVTICVNSTTCSVRSLWGVIDGLVGGVLHRIRLSDLLATEGQVSFSLRQHLEATMDQILGDNRRPPAKALPMIEA